MCFLVTELQDVRCGDDGCQTDGPENRECYPIMEPQDDTSSGGGRRCLMFVRSLGAPPANCAMGSIHRFWIDYLLIWFQVSGTYCTALYSASSVNICGSVVATTKCIRSGRAMFTRVISVGHIFIRVYRSVCSSYRYAIWWKMEVAILLMRLIHFY